MKTKCLFVAAICAAGLLAACQKEENVTPSGPAEVTLNVDETPKTFDCLENSFNIKVECSTSSTAQVIYGENTEDNWISLSPASLKGNGSYQVKITGYDNPLGARKAEIEIKAADKIAKVAITQNPPESVSLSTSGVVAIDSERTYSISVTSNTTWEAHTDDSWIEILKGNGTAGTEKLQIKVAAIGDVEKRDGAVVITAGNTGAILKVSQGYGVLMGNLIWAKYNVDEPGTFAADPEKYGKVYCYDNKTPFPIYGDLALEEDWTVLGKTTPPDYPVNNAYSGADTWAADNNPCPAGWRIPTEAELWTLIGGEEQAKLDNEHHLRWDFRWYHYNQGVWIGENAKTANKDDHKGCIFIPFAGYRGWADGTQQEGRNRVWVQTITRPEGNNWQRRCFIFNWVTTPDAMAVIGCENNDALIIRPVADLIEE